VAKGPLAEKALRDVQGNGWFFGEKKGGMMTAVGIRLRGVKTKLIVRIQRSRRQKKGARRRRGTLLLSWGKVPIVLRRDKGRVSSGFHHTAQKHRAWGLL